MKVALKTVGLNTVIFKDSADLNNVFFEVYNVISYSRRDLIAKCGTFSDALSIAQNLIK